MARKNGRKGSMLAAAGRGIARGLSPPAGTPKLGSTSEPPKSLRADAIAGLTSATIVLPQGVAFAAIAGLPPQYGFYKAMITPVVAGLAGSSRHAVSGPTTAISALVFAALAPTMTPGSDSFIAAAIVLALMVGVIQFVFGFVKLGGLVDFVSYSVMLGFVAVAASFIVLSQVTHAINLPLPRPEHLGEFTLKQIASILTRESALSYCFLDSAHGGGAP